MITQQEIRINAKNQPTYVLPDCINYLWTSNQPDSFFLEDKDRRFFIHEATASPKPAAFYKAYGQWLKKGGAAAVHHYLKTLDLGDFDPAAKAFHTQAKDRMTRNARSDLANWVRDLIGNPDGYLRIGEAQMPGDLFTNKQLMGAWAAKVGEDEAKRTPAKRLASELARAGAKQVHGGQPVSLPGQPVDRYYAIRNVARWAGATLAEIQAHLTTPGSEDALPKPTAAHHRGGKGRKPKKF